MPAPSTGLISQSFAVFAKDLRLELRNKQATNVLLMFAVTTLTVVSLSLGQESLSPWVVAALFWIILLFSAMAGLARVFVYEEDGQTALALRLLADPTAVYLGKLTFNLTLLTAITTIVAPAYVILMSVDLQNVPLLLIPLILGVIGLCAGSTLIGAIIARAAVKGALFSVLAFPILILLLLLLVNATAKILAGGGLADISMEIQGLVAYCVVMITASLMLFRFVWNS